jgi:hypothetical protein
VLVNATKVNMGSRGIPPFIFNLSTWLWQVISFVTWLIHPGTPWTLVRWTWALVWTVWIREISLFHGETWTLDYPAHCLVPKLTTMSRTVLEQTADYINIKKKIPVPLLYNDLQTSFTIKQLQSLKMEKDVSYLSD